MTRIYNLALRIISILTAVGSLVYGIVLLVLMVQNPALRSTKAVTLQVVGAAIVTMQAVLSGIASRTRDLRVCWAVWVAQCGILGFLLMEHAKESLWFAAISGLYVVLWAIKGAATLIKAPETL